MKRTLTGLIFSIMAMALKQNAVADADPAFVRVDTRTPAHLLEPGVAADATNKRFEDGKARCRHNVQQGPWGVHTEQFDNLIAAGETYAGFPLPPVYQINVTAGETYVVKWGANEASILLNNVIWNPDNTLPASAITVEKTYNGGYSEFVPILDHVFLVGNANSAAVTAAVGKAQEPFKERGFKRFNDPQGLDVCVSATDEWRTKSGEDGGRGRLWKILANNAPVEIPLNGHDIWDTCRLVPCYNGLVLLRHGNERHYFQAAAVASPADNQIQLNCQPAWQNGESVFLWGDPSVASAITGTSAPSSSSFCFVKNVGNNVVELYADSQLGQQLAFTAATGRFYLERRASNPGKFGNGAPPLLAQPDAAGKTLWETGMAAVPVDLAVTNTVASSDVWTVPNHRLNPGDEITLANMPAAHTPADGDYFAVPLNDHQLLLFDTLVHAQLRVADATSTAGLEDIGTDGETLPTMKKKAASGLPMPPATEGFYTENNRLVLVNGTTLLISDPLDPLHYSPMEADITANLGESDAIVGVSSFLTSDSLVIAKEKSILALYNLSGGPSQWALRSVTHEYGCLSALTLRQWGSRLLFLSRRGLDSVALTAYGTILPVERPVSYDMKKYVDRIDWNQAGVSCVETWNNRLFWAVRLKTGSIVAGNNAVLTINFLNSNQAQELFAWEGIWTGDSLVPAGWARHTIAGEERLTFATADGQVYWLGDGSLDKGNVAIADSLTTRLYTGAGMLGMNARKIFNRSLFIWDANNALATVTAITPGWRETTVLTPDGGLAYDATQYAAGENNSYNPATQSPAFNAPYREDYAIQSVTELIGGQPDVLQNHSEPFRLREDDWAVQFQIDNARGQLQVRSVNVSGFIGPSSERSRV